MMRLRTHEKAMMEPAPATGSPSQAAGFWGPSMTARRTVLVVEDEPPVRATLVGVLDRCGYAALEASSLVEALEVALSHSGQLDVVLLDAGLLLSAGAPPLDALLAACRGAQVVYCSGYDQEELESWGLLPPGAVFLSKPEVVRTICGALRRLALGPS